MSVENFDPHIRAGYLTTVTRTARKRSVVVRLRLVWLCCVQLRITVCSTAASESLLKAGFVMLLWFLASTDSSLWTEISPVLLSIPCVAAHQEEEDVPGQALI